jgi:hypothetical protein
MFCKRCNGVISPTWEHCPACGVALEAPTEPAPVARETAPPPLTPGGPGRPPLVPPPPATGAPATPGLPTEPPPGAGYRSLRGLSVALVWLLGAATVAALATAGAFFHRRQLLEGVRGGDRLQVDDVHRADDLVTAALGVGFAIALAILVVLIVFLFRAAKNTQLWDRSKPRWAPGWTIGGWFIPVASIVIPALVVRDIWSRTPQRDIDGTERTVSGRIVGWWWVTWIAGGVLMRAGAVVAGDSPTVAELSNADLVRVAAAMVYAIAALLLVTVVRQLAQRQEHLRHPSLQPREFPTAARRMASPVR